MRMVLHESLKALQMRGWDERYECFLHLCPHVEHRRLGWGWGMTWAPQQLPQVPPGGSHARLCPSSQAVLPLLDEPYLYFLWLCSSSSALGHRSFWILAGVGNPVYLSVAAPPS